MLRWKKKVHLNFHHMHDSGCNSIVLPLSLTLTLAFTIAGSVVKNVLVNVTTYGATSFTACCISSQGGVFMHIDAIGIMDIKDIGRAGIVGQEVTRRIPTTSLILIVSVIVIANTTAMMSFVTPRCELAWHPPSCTQKRHPLAACKAQSPFPARQPAECISWKWNGYTNVWNLNLQLQITQVNGMMKVGLSCMCYVFLYVPIKI